MFIGTPAGWGWGFAGTVVPARLPPLFLMAGFSPDSAPSLHADLALEGRKPLDVREGALLPAGGMFDNVWQHVQLSHLREWGAAGIWKVEARDEAKHHSAEDSPPHPELSGPKC